MKKIIGITPRLTTERNVEKQFVNTRYLKPLKERGLDTLMLTLEGPNLEKILSMCDAFLITGGTDSDPIIYGEENTGLSKGVDQRLDDTDTLVIEHAVKHKKPLLGICRGMQSLNITLGGSLHQDLGELNESHNSVSKDHLITVIPNDFIDLKGVLNINSYHHQAINRLADDLEVLGSHADGTVEMVKHKTLPMFGVQWHPEIHSDSNVSKVIFDKFNELIIKK